MSEEPTGEKNSSESTLGRDAEAARLPQLPKAYLMGDGGEDQVEYNNHAYTVPSGAFFIAEALRAFNKGVLDVETIIAAVAGTGANTSGAQAKIDPLPQRVWTLKDYKEQSDDPKVKAPAVVRLEKYESRDPAKALPAPSKIVFSPPAQIEPHSLLIAHHAGDRWLDPSQTGACAFIKEFLAAKADWLPPGMPRVLVNLSSKFPERDLREGAELDRPFTSALWNHLFEHRSRVAIVLSLSTLRAEGGTVSKRLSWEQNVEDVAAELHLFPALRVLSHFRHLFVRCGTVAVIHIENDAWSLQPNKLSGRLYFTPYARGVVHRNHELHGGFLGRNAILLSSLARAIAGAAGSNSKAAELAEKERHSAEVHEEVRGDRDSVFFDAIGKALRAMRAVDDAGYLDAIQARPAADFATRHMRLAAKGFDVDLNHKPGDKDTTRWRPIPSYLLHPPLPNALRHSQRWHILDDVLLEAPIHRVNVAMAIVKLGHQEVLNRFWKESASGTALDVWKTLTRVEYLNPKDRAPDYVTLEDGDLPATPEWPGGKPPTTPRHIGEYEQGFSLDVPVASFAKLILVERDEVEEFRGISNLLRAYRTRAEAHQQPKGESLEPISVAVFGPPGSGKSFGVKQIAEAIDKDAIPLLEFNVSQFRQPEDFRAAFLEVKKKRTELVAHANKLGNQVFVTPLVFFDEFDSAKDDQQLGWLRYFLAPMQDGTFGDISDIGPAIFVFAGGIFPTFERFDPSTDSAYDNLRDLPEYKERLRNFAEQKGPDFTSRLRGHINILGINDAPGRPKHFIRRAIQIRGALQKAKLVSPESGRANVDDPIIYALLTVDRYRHGVRSMQAIIEMCSANRGRLEIASLPSRSQLDMHVDADEFMVRVSRGRARAQAEWNA